MLGKRDKYPENSDSKDETTKKLKPQNEEGEEDDSDIEEYVHKFNPDDFVIEDDGIYF